MTEFSSCHLLSILPFQIEILQLRIPFAEYTKAKKEYDQSRIDMKASKRELERLRAENEPLERELEKISEHGQKLKLRKDTNFRKLKEQEKDYKKLAGKLEEIEKKSEDLMSDMTSIKKREADRKKRLEKLEKQIETLENQIDNEPERIDTSGYEKRIVSSFSNYRTSSRSHSSITLSSLPIFILTNLTERDQC